MSTVRERLRPQTQPTRAYLGSNLFVVGALQIVSAAVLAGLAMSRAEGNQLPAWTTFTIVVVASAVGAAFGLVASYIGGAHDATAGLVEPDPDEPPGTAVDDLPDDPFDAGALWRKAGLWGVVTAFWAATVGLLVVAALDGRFASFPILFVALVVASATSSVTTDLAWRTRGIGAARRGAGDVVRSARRRAWLEIGLPIALIIGGSTAGATWVLFHDYAIADPFAERVLTEAELFADLGIVILLVGGFVIFLCGRAGRTEARLGVVTVGDPDLMLPPPKQRFGFQGLVYAGVATFVVASVVRLVVPADPQLWQAIVVRGGMAFGLAWVFAALGYIRGVGNAVREDA